jgi:alkylhydroperoxidase family enzyme
MVGRVTIPQAERDNAVAYVYRSYAPNLTGALSGLSLAVYQETQLPIRVVEAARVRTAQINGCRTCQTWRSARDLPPVLAQAGGDVGRSFVGRAESVPDEVFYAAVEDWRGSPLFDERERLAIELAERMGEAPRSFEGDEAFWDRMHEGFTDDEIVDLVVSVASWIAGGRVMHVLEVDPEVCVLESAPVTAGT